MPLPAASVLLLRGDPFEILFMRRPAESSFVPGAWVFPGGAVDEADRAVAAEIGGEIELLTMKICGIRELFEEAGIWLGCHMPDSDAMRDGLIRRQQTLGARTDDLREAAGRLVFTSRWVTPAGIPKRYDTWFFLAACDGPTAESPQEGEVVELRWATPDEALQRCERGEMPMVFPTIRNLEAIRGFRSAAELLEARRGATVPVTRPRLVIDGRNRRIVLPDEES
ncbi:MAG: NUDIX hydrolase [Thermoanaerobaculia bacterium]